MKRATKHVSFENKQLSKKDNCFNTIWKKWVLRLMINIKMTIHDVLISSKQIFSVSVNFFTHVKYSRHIACLTEKKISQITNEARYNVIVFCNL